MTPDEAAKAQRRAVDEAGGIGCVPLEALHLAELERLAGSYAASLQVLKRVKSEVRAPTAALGLTRRTLVEQAFHLALDADRGVAKKAFVLADSLGRRVKGVGSAGEPSLDEWLPLDVLELAVEASFRFDRSERYVFYSGRATRARKRLGRPSS